MLNEINRDKCDVLQKISKKNKKNQPIQAGFLNKERSNFTDFLQICH